MGALGLVHTLMNAGAASLEVSDARAVHRYALHGLRIRSELALCAPPSADAHELDARLQSARRVGGDTPAGRVLAQAWLSDTVGYTHAETESGYILRYHFCCDFEVDRGRRLISAYPDPRAGAELAAVLLSGSVAAALLVIDGATVLHASAVDYGGKAVAFVGDSGSGKSTMAAIFCAAGAGLISDDMLRIAHRADGVRCFQGTSEIRLRQSAAQLAECFPREMLSATVDGRIGVRAAAGPSVAETALHAIVIPEPSRAARSVSVQRLGPVPALVALSSYPRVLGLRAPELIAAQFNGLAELTRRVPVYRAEIPWGPPFQPSIVPALLEQIGFARS